METEKTIQEKNGVEELVKKLGPYSHLTPGENGVEELVKKLEQHLQYTPEYNVEVLKILFNLIPFEEKLHVEDVNTVGGIAEYARSHADFKIGFSNSINYTLKSCVKELWKVEPEKAKEAIRKIIDGLAEIIETRSKMPKLKEKVFSLFDKLDLRTRLLIGIGGELEGMSGVNVDDYDNILDQYRQNCDELVEQARKDPELSSDKDIMSLCETYELACNINQSS